MSMEEMLQTSQAVPTPADYIGSAAVLHPNPEAMVLLLLPPTTVHTTMHPEAVTAAAVAVIPAVADTQVVAVIPAVADTPAEMLVAAECIVAEAADN